MASSNTSAYAKQARRYRVTHTIAVLAAIRCGSGPSGASKHTTVMLSKPPEQTHGAHPLSTALFWTVILAGLLLRGLHFDQQLLLDDEWHAIHQLLGDRSPVQLLLSFGSADYSIPLTLLYGLMSHSIGLSEPLVKLPLLLAGALTLILFSLWARRTYGPATGLLFAFLLSWSPMLLIYGWTARPYALTLLLAYCALWCFERWWSRPDAARPAAVGFVLLAALASWLHPLMGPFLLGPFCYCGISAWLRSDWPACKRLLLLGACYGALSAVLLLPPLIADFQALASKAGNAEITGQTLRGVWYFWLGMEHWPATLLLLLLALSGLPQMLRGSLMVRMASSGLLLTALALAITQPAWAQHPVTLGRYLLPTLPLLLLAIAGSLNQIWGWLKRQPLSGRGLGVTAMVVVLLWLPSQSVLPDLLRWPNTQRSHAVFQFALMPGPNPIVAYQRDRLARSDFWQQLARQSPDDSMVAVGPFYFESYNWDAVRWERDSARRIRPLMLAEFCAGQRPGEVPANRRFRFRNAVYPEHLERAGEQPAWVVLTKPFEGYAHGREQVPVGAAVYRSCRQKLEALLGAADYEDQALIAFRVLSETPTGDKPES